MTRDGFMDLVYDELCDDNDNCRANRIIDAADDYAYTDNVLKPCAFCRTTPATSIDISRYGRLGDCIAIKIICPECHIAKSMCVREGTDFGTVKKLMNEIVEDWNERVTDGEDRRCLNDKNKRHNYRNNKNF